MSRSFEMTFADDPVAGDPLLAELRAARPPTPDDLVDPQAPANQALLPAILDGVAGAADPPDAPRGRRRLGGRFLARAAAVAVIGATAAGLAVVWPFGSAEPSAADVVRQAAAASTSALDSGRATVTATTVFESTGAEPAVLPPEGSSEDVYEYRFAGDDVSVGMLLGTGFDTPYPGERRIVDGEMYWHAGPDPASPWFHQADGGPARSDWTGDPRSLLATLEPRAGFEIAGDDTVDGVEVTHLRSRTPSAFTPDGLGLGQALAGPGTLTGLDVWVDGDGVVRRIDVEVTQSFDVMVMEEPGGPEEQRTETQVTTATVRFSDIGVPNTIEAPANFCEVTDEMMADPPPPGADVC